MHKNKTVQGLSFTFKGSALLDIDRKQDKCLFVFGVNTIF